MELQIQVTKNPGENQQRFILCLIQSKTFLFFTWINALQYFQTELQTLAIEFK